MSVPMYKMPSIRMLDEDFVRLNPVFANLHRVYPIQPTHAIIRAPRKQEEDFSKGYYGHVAEYQITPVQTVSHRHYCVLDKPNSATLRHLSYQVLFERARDAKSLKWSEWDIPTILRHWRVVMFGDVYSMYEVHPDLRQFVAQASEMGRLDGIVSEDGADYAIGESFYPTDVFIYNPNHLIDAYYGILASKKTSHFAYSLETKTTLQMLKLGG